LFIKSSFEKKITTPGALHATILLTGLLILPQASMRSDTEHLFQVLPPSYLLLAYWIAQSLTALKNRSASLAARFSSGVSFMIVASSAIYLCISFLFLFHNYRSPFFTRFSREYKYEILDPPHARVLIPAQDSKFINSIVRFILEHSSKEDFLVCMPYEPIFNFLTGLRNPTRYDIFLPGEMDGSQEQQEEIIRSMATPRLKFIIIRYNELINNQDSGIKKKHLMRYYIPDVYQYILNNFYIERRIGPWVILKRKTIA